VSIDWAARKTEADEPGQLQEVKTEHIEAAEAWASEGTPDEDNEAYQDYLSWLAENASREVFEDLERIAREGQTRRDNEVRAASPEISTELALLHAQFAKHLDIEEIDKDVVEFALATYVSQKMPNEDPLWGVIVGASGGGKSEFLRPFMGRNDAFPLSELTPKSLNSGYVIKHGRGKGQIEEDPSLLPKMDGKVVIVSDLSPLLQMRPEIRNEVFAAIREAFDGEVNSGKGNQGLKKVRSRFTMLCASTFAIEHSSGENNEMGERFVRIKLRGKNRSTKARKVLTNFGNRNTMREELAKAVEMFITKLGDMQKRNIPEEIGNQVADIADFTAKARTFVKRDWRSHEVEYLPVAEEGTRLTLQLSKLLAAVAFIRGRVEPIESDLGIIRRVADDCIPTDRFKVLESLRSSQTPLVPGVIAKTTNMERNAVRRILDDLFLLECVTRKQVPGGRENEFEYSV
jgi:hypothetical protein